MAKTLYTQDHEWLQIEGDTITIGITDYAQEQLGDLVFVELPEIGRVLEKGETAVVVESVKAASDVYAPVGGTVSAINEAVSDDPSLVNTAAQDNGWLWKMTISDATQLEGLLDADAYKATIS